MIDGRLLVQANGLFPGQLDVGYVALHGDLRGALSLLVLIKLYAIGSLIWQVELFLPMSIDYIFAPSLIHEKEADHAEERHERETTE